MSERVSGARAEEARTEGTGRRKIRTARDRGAKGPSPRGGGGWGPGAGEEGGRSVISIPPFLSAQRRLQEQQREQCDALDAPPKVDVLVVRVGAVADRPQAVEGRRERAGQA